MKRKIIKKARVLKQVDRAGLKPAGKSRAGSNPAARTNVVLQRLRKLNRVKSPWDEKHREPTTIEWKIVNPGEIIEKLRNKLHAEGVLDEILAEYRKAREKHKPMRGHHEGWAVIKEEFDELWDEIKVDNYPRARKEAIQMAAMTLAYLVEVCDEKIVSNAADAALAT